MPKEVRITAEIKPGTPNIFAGNPVCQADNYVTGGPYVELATLSAVAGGGEILGIALEDGEPSSKIKIATGGLVKHGLTGLGIGSACAVTIDTGGNLTRITSPSAITDVPIAGYCNEVGDLVVQPKRLDYFNVRDFGAIGDGVADDTAAFLALFALIHRVFTDYTGLGYVYSGASIWVPIGRYRLTQTLVLPPYTSIRGASPKSALLQFDVPPSPATYPWGNGILATHFPGSIGGGPIVIESLGIVNVRSGDADIRALGNGAGIEFIGGGPLCSVINCDIMGWKKGIVCEATNSTLIERVNFGGMYGYGYPNTSDHPTKYRDSISIWLSGAGNTAFLDGQTGDYGLIIAGDTLVLGKDQSANFTVTFQTGDITIDDVIFRINEAAGYNMASQKPGPRIGLQGIVENNEFGSIRVIGGTAMAKCGFVVDEVKGLGIGHGFFSSAYSSGLTNHIQIRNNQFNGHWIGIYEEDGAAHLITNNNFNHPGRMALIRGFSDSVWESNESEGCQSDAYILFTGHGLIGQSITFQNNAISGSDSATWIKFEYTNTLIYHFTCTGNSWYQGGSGGRPYIDTKSQTNISGRIILDPPNWNYKTALIGHEQQPFVQVRSFDKSKFGIGTALPRAAIDVRHTYTGSESPEATMILRVGDDPSFFVATSFERWERGMKRQTGSDIQQGIMELFERGSWSSEGPIYHNHREVGGPIGLVISMIDGEVAELVIRVEMTAAIGNSCIMWLFRRLAYCQSGTVVLDTDTSDDRTRAIGSLPAGGTWSSPIIATIGREVHIQIKSASTDFGQWLAYVESLQRSAF